jgi:hypothetical protein
VLVGRRSAGSERESWERDGVGRWAGRLGGRHSVGGQRLVRWTVERGRFGKLEEILDKFCLKVSRPAFSRVFFFNQKIKNLCHGGRGSNSHPPYRRARFFIYARTSVSWHIYINKRILHF